MAYKTPSPLHDCSTYSRKNVSMNQRASLEKDTKELITEIKLLEEEVANRSREGSRDGENFSSAKPERSPLPSSEQVV
ncbi:hypothetical protein V6N11_081846 [Hibiscus sabdariffa]|uniref:Uncharacterized protein n=1 Tax=Hibiscus sabdariffa TaxID=183260 RepID=A0ABR2Q7C7_9ROSI